MKAKDYLRQLLKIERMIRNKTEEKKRLWEMATNTTSSLNPVKVQSFGSQQKMADATERCVDVEREINACIDKLIDSRQDIIATIEQLSATEYDVLHMIYVQYRTFDQVAASYEKSYSWVTTVHGRALNNVQRILDAKKV